MSGCQRLALRGLSLAAGLKKPNWETTVEAFPANNAKAVEAANHHLKSWLGGPVEVGRCLAPSRRDNVLCGWVYDMRPSWAGLTCGSVTVEFDRPISDASAEVVEVKSKPVS